MSWAVWVTGLPGSGKTAIAKRVRGVLKDLKERGVADAELPKVLELDEVRKFVTPKPSYSEAEREVVYASLVFMARLLVEECGRSVLIDATANRRRYRERARESIPNFAEVFVQCPLEKCVERERRRKAKHSPAGIYAKGREKGATVPGVNVPYEEPLNPEVVVNSGELSVQECAEYVVEFILKNFSQVYNNTINIYKHRS